MRKFFILVWWVASGAGAQSLTNATTAAPTAPFSEVRYGRTVDDPYRWMEADERQADLLAYVRGQSEAATAQLQVLPGRDALVSLIDAGARAGVRNSDVHMAAGTVFWRQLAADDRTAKLMVRTGGVTRVLYDPAQEPADPAGAAAINSYTVSPDGRTVALHVSHGGAEIADIRFLDVATGRETLARLGPVWGEFHVAWLGHGRVAYTRMAATAAGGDAMQGMTVFVGRPGGRYTPVLGSNAPGGPAFAPAVFPVLSAPPTSQWVNGLAVNAGSDPAVYVARGADIAAGKPIWRQTFGPADRIVDSTLLGDATYAITTRRASGGELVRQPITGGTAQVVALPDDLVFTSVVAARDGVYVVGVHDGVSRLFWIAGGKGAAKEVPLPFEADVSSIDATADGQAVTMTLAGWTTAPRSYVARHGRLASLNVDSGSWADAASLSVRRESAKSADGTDVPMVIVERPSDHPRRVLIEAYGAYGESVTTPWYNPYYLAWSARGNTMVYCGARGGGERGRAWRDAGRLANKPNGQADFIACAERVVALGLARPKGIAGTGTSAGGLLVPRAVEQRPDLFGALLARVAVLNATRLEVAPNGANQFGEMGDPHTEDGWRALAASDAYLGLATASDLPDTLLTIGLNDHRVAPWMSAKFAAAALAKFGASRRVLIRAEAAGGHGMGTARDLQVAEFADSYAFLEAVLAP